MKRIFYIIFIILGVMILSLDSGGIVYYSSEKYNTQLVMKMTPEVKKLTNNISRSFSRETALCLSYSKPIKNVILIDDYKIPHIIYSTGESVTSRRCSDKYPIAWHNHPPRLVNNFILKLWWQKNTGINIDNRKKLVYLSNTDIKYTLQGRNEYMIVSSGDDNWAWWSRDQVAQYADSSYALPLEGQHYFEK